MHGDSSADFRGRGCSCRIDNSAGGRLLLCVQRIDELLQECRHAMIYGGGGLGGLKPSGRLFLAAQDQRVAIRGEKFMQHLPTIVHSDMVRGALPYTPPT